MLPLTEFGKAVKKARLDIGFTQSEMASELGVSYGLLSDLERGKRKINKDWVLRIDSFFKNKGVLVEDLDVLADVSNGVVDISNLPLEQKLLVVKVAHLTLGELQEFKSYLSELRSYDGL